MALRPGHGGDALCKENGGDDGELHFESVWWFWIVLDSGDCDCDEDDELKKDVVG
jgi:hypothetical protein